MIGSLFGDFVGSVYEFNNHRSKEFPLVNRHKDFTDDSVCTIATMDWLNNFAISPNRDSGYQQYVKKWCEKYPNPMGGYGGMFQIWLQFWPQRPYGSFGNGSAMRVAPVGFLNITDDEAMELAKQNAEITHNHEIGILGAQVVVAAIRLLRAGGTKRDLFKKLAEEFPMFLPDHNIHWYSKHNTFNETCQKTLPVVFACILESESFEDAIRNAVYVGGDTDTIACIVGGLAEALYGFTLPENTLIDFWHRVPDDFLAVLKKFYALNGLPLPIPTAITN